MCSAGAPFECNRPRPFKGLDADGGHSRRYQGFRIVRLVVAQMEAGDFASIFVDNGNVPISANAERGISQGVRNVRAKLFGCFVIGQFGPNTITYRNGVLHVEIVAWHAQSHRFRQRTNM